MVGQLILHLREKSEFAHTVLTGTSSFLAAPQAGLGVPPPLTLSKHPPSGSGLVPQQRAP